jgi:hypothetical protein
MCRNPGTRKPLDRSRREIANALIELVQAHSLLAITRDAETTSVHLGVGFLFLAYKSFRQTNGAIIPLK